MFGFKMFLTQWVLTCDIRSWRLKTYLPICSVLCSHSCKILCLNSLASCSFYSMELLGAHWRLAHYIGFGLRHYFLICVIGNKGVNPARVKLLRLIICNARGEMYTDSPEGAGCAQTMLPTSFMLYFAYKWVFLDTLIFL